MEAQTLTDVSIVWPSWRELWDVLSFSAGYNSAVVVLGATILGLAGGVTGSFSLLRRRALISDAIAHCALPGIAVAFLVSVYWAEGERSLLLLLFGAACSGVLGVLCVQFITRHTRLQEDSAIGSVLGVFFGFGILLLSLIQALGTGKEAGLSRFIYGQTASMRLFDAQLTLAAAVCAILLIFFLFKELRLICFDREFAEVQGWSVAGIDLALMSAIVLITVVGLQSVGLLLVVALLIVPAAAARFWTERLRSMVWIAGLFGAASGYFGAAASSLLPRLPAGSVIVLTSGLIFAVSFFAAPRRGLAASLSRSLRLRMKITEDHFLRDLYEFFEAQTESTRDFRAKELPFLKQLNWLERGLILRLSGWRHLIVEGHADGMYRATAQGLRRARRLTRNHRLWEEFIFTQGHVASSHVDYSADLVEHILSADLVQLLEEALVKKGKMPEELASLASLHPLS